METEDAQNTPAMKMLFSKVKKHTIDLHTSLDMLNDLKEEARS